MYAAHLAAGLAIKGRVPRTPTWALMTAVFLPDLLRWVLRASSRSRDGWVSGRMFAASGLLVIGLHLLAL